MTRLLEASGGKPHATTQPGQGSEPEPPTAQGTDPPVEQPGQNLSMHNEL